MTDRTKVPTEDFGFWKPDDWKPWHKRLSAKLRRWLEQGLIGKPGIKTRGEA